MNIVTKLVKHCVKNLIKGIKIRIPVRPTQPQLNVHAAVHVQPQKTRVVRAVTSSNNLHHVMPTKRINILDIQKNKNFICENFKTSLQLHIIAVNSKCSEHIPNKQIKTLSRNPNILLTSLQSPSRQPNRKSRLRKEQ